MIEIPDDLHEACLPLVWLLGRWEGVGLGDYPTIEAFRFGQEVEFTYLPGKPFLSYTSKSWILDDDGNFVRPAARETGYWRPQEGNEVEVLLTHPTGFVEIYLGQVETAKIEMATRGVLKTEGAKDYRTGHRLYGLVEGKLMYVYEMSAMGHELLPHLSAELHRVTGSSQARE
ncbi:uncharacterized protein DUF1794 [Haloactinopolyspora alba]|uniref:Peroxynitrite isomerase n=1 Tax=Haloactinopolyspora alba TaxID=648780 RepID=A0A2P8DJZ9_9ACTN|nr:FABP family protein [Haloactinopolyspora alba]PSK97550.1 uncharacterized protein DUF1794 [Haloactinopolyspora alba]